MATLNLKLKFGHPGYVEHPYWPEMYDCIEIEKKSGINRCRTDKTRREALQAYLEEHKMTLADYQRLKELSLRPFHKDERGIFIPWDKVLSCLSNASQVAPRKMRIEQVRVAVASTDFVTNRTEPDGVWKRFAVVNMGSGMKASNQRGMRENAYIRDFEAVGTLDVQEDMVEPDALLVLLEYAGRSVGIGASRKMGYGRFTVERI